MNLRKWSLGIVFAAITFLLIVGVKQRNQHPVAPKAVAEAPVPAPARAFPPTTRPAAEPAIAQPPGILMTIDQGLVDFPQAKIRVSKGESGVTAVLFSSDPPAAIDDDYRGNSFYLTMPLKEIKDTAHLDGAQWHYRAVSSERQEGHDGIFLQGLRFRLRPQDVQVRISGDGPELRVQMAGQFLTFDTLNQSQLGQITQVSADFAASIETRSSPAK